MTDQLTSALSYLDNSRTNSPKLSPQSHQRPCLRYSRCGRGGCINCATRTAKKRIPNIVQNIIHRKNLWYLVLTIENHPCLETQMEKLYKGLENMRDRPYWKKHVIGGCVRLDVPHNHESCTWHAHFELIIEAVNDDPLDVSSIRWDWIDLTGGTEVYLEPVGRTRQDVWNLTDYVNKAPFSRLTRHDSLMDEYSRVAHGRQKFWKFGCWRNSRKNPKNWVPAKRSKRRRHAPLNAPILKAPLLPKWELPDLTLPVDPAPRIPQGQVAESKAVSTIRPADPQGQAFKPRVGWEWVTAFPSTSPGAFAPRRNPVALGAQLPASPPNAFMGQSRGSGIKSNPPVKGMASSTSLSAPGS